MKAVGLRLPEELLAAIDEARGQVPRERWIRDVLSRAVAAPPSGPAYVADPPEVPPVEIREPDPPKPTRGRSAPSERGPVGSIETHKFVPESAQVTKVCKVCGKAPIHPVHG